MAVANAMMMGGVGCQMATFECRATPSSGSAKLDQSELKGTARVRARGRGGFAFTHWAGAPLIFRFPPNFERQLSIKARRNCSNIGVAQVVAASATNIPLASAPASVDPIGVTCSNNNNNTTCVQDDGAMLQADLLNSAGTLAVHSGERSGRSIVTDAIATPIVQTSTYTFKDTAELIAFQEGRHKSFEYGRYGNPTTQVAEEKISALEGAETTLLLASGMCATTTMMLALVPAGGHIITTTDCYRRTRQFIQTVLPKMGITATVIDPADIDSLKLALDKNNVSLFFSESPTNPYLRCIDIELVSKLCHRKGALVCIDCTFATPVNQKALALGADIVLHSVTKYIAGHNDVLAGSLSGSHKNIGVIRALHNVMGGVLSPNAAYLILRGMKTLHLRVQQQNLTALRIARTLEAHSKVTHVHYPGLESHPEHHIAKRQMSGFGGVVSFEIAGDLQATSRFIDSLKIPYIAPSLGGCESLVEQPTIISYWDQSPAERARIGIKDNLVRFSCGVEDFEDIQSDILQALDAI
uniref:plant cystathionine gamma-synthase n=1 Tax=Wollemia nobilis TaxID=56998 RepID=A0A0C9RYM6_9CONI